MKLHLPTRPIASRAGVVIVAGMVLLLLWAVPEDRTGAIALLASVGGSSAAALAAAAENDGDAIRPFMFHASDEDLAELRRRIAATKRPERETVADATQGVQLETMQKLARYWATDYNWRKAEAKLNSFPQFITTIDGLDIHFIHVRSKYKNALPLIITHGWPGSIIEQMKVIGPLTDPTSYGGRAEDAFDVVIPSLPGYGFSAKPTAPGWTPPRIARAWTDLMKRLGYTRLVAQGGDWGNAVSEVMALQAPPALLGISTNMAATVPADLARHSSSGRRVRSREAASRWAGHWNVRGAIRCSRP